MAIIILVIDRKVCLKDSCADMEKVDCPRTIISYFYREKLVPKPVRSAEIGNSEE